MSKITTVGELKSAHATLVACLNNVLCNLYVAIVEYRYHTGFGNLCKHLLFVEFSHN